MVLQKDRSQRTDPRGQSLPFSSSETRTHATASIYTHTCTCKYVLCSTQYTARTHTHKIYIHTHIKLHWHLLIMILFWRSRSKILTFVVEECVGCDAIYVLLLWTTSHLRVFFNCTVQNVQINLTSFIATNTWLSAKRSLLSWYA